MRTPRTQKGTRRKKSRNIQASLDASVDTSIARDASQWREPPDELTSELQRLKQNITDNNRTIASIESEPIQGGSVGRRQASRRVSRLRLKVESDTDKFKELMNVLRYWAWNKYFYEIPRARATWHKYFSDN
tara:strand:- start:122 stop:517 length:396 start_codon:yes stop_codon:yes gene_type:complete